MLKVVEIVNKLPDVHKQGVRSVMATNGAFAAISLQLFEAYLAGKSEEEAYLDSDLEYREFKIIERLVYRAIISFYNLEDKKIRDLIPSSIFYALHGTIEKTDLEKKELLKGLFHQMKQHDIDEEALPLIDALLKLFQNTQMKGVYVELSKYYQGINQAIQKAIALFEEFNNLLKQQAINPSKNTVQQQIIVFKKIRTLVSQRPSPTTIAIFNLCKLILVVRSKQTQILKDGNWDTTSLLNYSKQKIDCLPFSIKRFYLQNIWEQINLPYSDIAIDSNTLNHLRKNLNAYNFGYPSTNKFGNVQAIKVPTHHQLSPKGNNLAVKVINHELNSTIKRAFNLYYLNSLRLSHPI